jgi:hypothetical protein
MINLKHTVVRIKIFFILTTICAGNNNCYYKIKDVPIRAINIVASTPMVRSENGQLINLADTIKIIYHENSILFLIPYFDQLINIVTNKSGDVLGEKLIKQELRYKLFIYRKGSVHGFMYDSLTAKNGEKLSVDSLLSERSFQNMKFFSVYKSSNDSLIETLTDSKKEFLTEKYLTKVKYDESYNDTTYLYYAKKLNGIDFSFSKELDSIKNMKLFKIRYIYNSLQSDKYSFVIPKREFLFEIMEVPVANPKEIIDFISRFERSESN